MRDDREHIAIIGAGHNGLITAFYLAKAGFRPIVLERAAVAGGSAVTEEIHPGFQCPVLFDTPGPLLPRIVRDTKLDERKLFARVDLQMTVFDPDRRRLRIPTGPDLTGAELLSFSSHDARKFPEFHRTLQRLGEALRPLLSTTPPEIDHLDFHDWRNLARCGMRFKKLDRKDAYRLLRWGPMPIADLASEWFRTEALQAAVAGCGIFGMSAGPRSGGTAAGLLMQAALGTPRPIRQGGIGVLTEALRKAAIAAGAEIRTAAKVTRIVVKNRQARGVLIEGGEEIAARAVVSNADPQQTFLKLIDPTELDPGFVSKMQSYRTLGSVAKVNLALSELPAFAESAAQIQIGPDIDYLERAFDAAKYGEFSRNPFLRMTVPSVWDRSLAPPDRHVMSIFVQYAPYRLKTGNWESRRDELGDVVVNTLSAYAPGIDKLVLNRQILTPVDIERRFGMSGGHIFHGEHALDQLFLFRPLLGWARYRTPVKGLYLCGSGTHPGGGITGAPGLNASREILRDL